MKIGWKTCFRVSVSIFALYLCMSFWPQIVSLVVSFLNAAAPLIIGAGIAYLINILMTAYERRYTTKNAVLLKLRRPICLVGAILTLLAIIALVVMIVVPEVVAAIRLIIAELPEAIDFLLDKALQFHILPKDIINFLDSIDWQSHFTKIMDLLTSGIGDVMGTVIKTVSSVFSALITAFLSIIFSIYLLVSKDRLKAQAKRVMRHYLPEKLNGKIIYVLTVADDCFRKYIIGQCLEAIILGVLCTAGMIIFKFPYATMVGALMAFTALIPVAGAYIGAAVGAFMILTAAPFMKAFLFLVFILVLQQLEGNLIYPRVVGTSMGLPGIWVLASITVGGGMMGILGMFLGVPIAATAYRLIQNDMNGETPKKKAAAEAKESAVKAEKSV